MLDTLLAGAGCFCRGDRFRNMPFEWNATLAGLVGDREVGVAGQPAIDLDKVRATIPLLFHHFASLSFIGHNNGIGPDRIWAVDDGTAEVDGRRWIFVGRRVRSAPRTGVRRARHVADADDSVSHKKKVAPGSAG